MSSFAATACKFVAPDPCKHVKFTRGMVLGVDDLEQEFAYHGGHLQCAISDLLGYGTFTGLQVLVDDKDPKNPRIRVTNGVAASPLGHLICVPADQCAYLNEWLAIPENKQQVGTHKLSTGSPPGQSVQLYIVLCYRACPTDPVPIAGEPCRSEDLSMAPSRWTDDFTLEFRLEPPDQWEEEAVRQFVQRLANVEITETDASVPLKDFLDAIRASVVITSPPDSPPSLHDFFLGSPLATLRINTADVCKYLRAAFRLWVTELRPRWHAPGFGQGSCCQSDEPGDTKKATEDCVLLAALHVPLTAADEVADVKKVVVDEKKRPILLHTRMLQEWLLCGRAFPSPLTGLLSPPGGLAPATSGQPKVVAAGRFQADGTREFAWNDDLTAVPIGVGSMYLLRFSSFDPGGRYVVKGTAITTAASGTAHVFEVIPASEAATLISPLGDVDGIMIRVRQGMDSDASATLQGFMVEITRY
jgi:hypothetical protein